MKNTKIEWTDTTWNPVSGCTRASAGCDNCYAVTMTKRLEAMGQAKYAGLVNIGKNHFNGVVKCHEEALTLPLGWKKPQKIFVNSMSDLFHPEVPFEFIDKVFAIMALSPQHTFQILTKRPERMAEYLNGHPGLTRPQLVGIEAARMNDGFEGIEWPLPNVWLGVSVEDQRAADERIPHLLRIPAAVRFLSCEPLLGPVDLRRLSVRPGRFIDCLTCDYHDGVGSVIAGPPSGTGPIDWVICGGESGPNARPMHPDWARSLRDQCQAAGVPFFFKQWGEYHPRLMHGVWPDTRTGCCDNLPSVHIHEDGYVHRIGDRGTPTNMKRVGKKRAGRLLDGKEWNEFPGVEK